MNENFTTEHLENRHRFDAWREAVCSRLIRAEAKQVKGGVFSGRFSYAPLGHLDIANHVSQASMLWQRTPDCIRRHPNADFYLGYICDGSGQLRQHHRETRVSAGDMVIYDASAPFDFAMENVSMNIVHLPRRLIEREAPVIAGMSGTSLDRSRPGIAVLRQMMEEAFRFNPAQEGRCLTEQFANTFFTLIATSLNLQKSEEELKPTLYARLLSYLRQRLQDPDLCVAQIANAHHVSPRTVSRVFAAQGTTPMNVVWHERLLACHRALAEGRARNITQVALDYGFSDMSHFSLAFRKAFGYTPSSLLQPSPRLPGRG